MVSGILKSPAKYIQGILDKLDLYIHEIVKSLLIIISNIRKQRIIPTLNKCFHYGDYKLNYKVFSIKYTRDEVNRLESKMCGIKCNEYKLH